MLTIGGTVFLLSSACRHAARTISSTYPSTGVSYVSGFCNQIQEVKAALRLVSEEPINDNQFRFG